MPMTLKEFSQQYVLARAMAVSGAFFPEDHVGKARMVWLLIEQEYSHDKASTGVKKTE